MFGSWVGRLRKNCQGVRRINSRQITPLKRRWGKRKEKKGEGRYLLPSRVIQLK